MFIEILQTTLRLRIIKYKWFLGVPQGEKCIFEENIRITLFDLVTIEINTAFF